MVLRIASWHHRHNSITLYDGSFIVCQIMHHPGLFTLTMLHATGHCLCKVEFHGSSTIL